ncbi:glycosyltransferase family 4 protein [Chroococcidiopsis sp.]|uniref:glycosyltransferase family 4 protein n=1 Tax=Chroococcidiopsis sp. TaxID=3088168 RepID=UPI003F31509A
MDVAIALEHRFESTPDGKVWTQTQFPYQFWLRYLEVFERVCVVARVREVPNAQPGWQRADGEGVSFAAVPYYIGLWQYLLRSRQVKHAARNAVGNSDAVILRVSSTIGACIEPMLRKTGHPYGVEVVADPYDLFAPGSIKHPLRPLFRWYFFNELRHHCAGAAIAAYVTQNALQQRYPPAKNAFSTYYSDVELPDSAFASAPRFSLQEKRAIALILVGTLAQLYKAPDVLIKAVASCIHDKGLNLTLTLVGDGKHRSELEALAAELKIAEYVRFLGQLTVGDAVRTQLDRADLFVLPSYQEGMPRAMIEAMARGLPCIGSTVGGIPELLPAEDMVSPGNVMALADKIHEIAIDPDRMAQMSVRNLEKAKEYREKLLRERRSEFYRQVRKTTEAWLNIKEGQKIVRVARS